MTEKSWSSCASIKSLKGCRSNGQKPLDRNRSVCCDAASTRLRSLAVMNPLHAGHAYSNFATTMARLQSVTWEAVTSEHSQSLKSLGTVSYCFCNIWLEAECVLVIVTPRIFACIRPI